MRDMNSQSAPSIPLDEIELKIINYLRKDGRMTHRELARRIDVSETTIRNRLRSLQERGVFRIVAMIEPQKVGFNLDVFLHMKVEVQRLESIARHLASLNSVRFVAITGGAYDILCAALLADYEDYLRFLTSEISPIEGIRSIETAFSLKVLKRTYDWHEMKIE